MKKVLALSAVFLFIFAVRTSADTVIGFDDVASGTNVSTHYAGVTLICHGSACAGGSGSNSVFATSSPFAASPGNIVSTSTPGGLAEDINGNIEVDFASAQSAVSIEDFLIQSPEHLADTGGYGFLIAYDSAFNQIGAEQFDTTLGSQVVMSIAGSGNISHLLFGDNQGGAADFISLFDNLCYSTDAAGCSASGSGGSGDNGGGGTVPTPEPGTLLSLGLGLAGLVGMGLRKRSALPVLA